ncbi:hypothetical protein [Abyssalbus ytuae]|uniref:Uncharacterized protein n=1 Tax=Abyssalbus ytuae TaxID=2926907 RepID=A0A9E7A080_9FLAO|nr:hypothetical protein [Abyssalbus ytuae]UOB18427.1 hypothetical protein MQE35_03845 [Abyssalbus ytuae]
MKKIYMLTLICLMGGYVSSAQVHIHTHLNNNDAETRKKLGDLMVKIINRTIILDKTNRDLEKIYIYHKAQLKKKYNRNRFDKRDNFLTQTAGSLALSLGTSILTQYAQLPYMTKAKREYINNTAMNKDLLIYLQYLDSKKIKASQRQEIYRLRSELIREISKNDRESRKMLMFSAVGWALINYAVFVEISRKLNEVEIAL